MNFLYKNGNNFKLDNAEIYINDNSIQPLMNRNYIYINFTKLGRYKINFNFNNILYDMSDLFGKMALSLKKIKFFIDLIVRK